MSSKIDKNKKALWNTIQTVLSSYRQAPPLQPVSRKENLPLSFAQERLWFLSQLEPGNPVYNMFFAFHLTGSLNITVLEKSLREIVQRHEILRTTFPSVNGQPFQVISPNVDLRLLIVDLREFSKIDQEVQYQKAAWDEARRPFDLAQGPLLRTQLLYLAEKEYILFITAHHIVYDSWSHGVFLKELAILYKTFCTDKPSPLPELPVQYADFAYWQKQWLHSDEILKFQLSYWEKQLGNNLFIRKLPVDKPRPSFLTYEGNRQSIILSQNLTTALQALSQRQGITLFITLLVAFKILLYQYTRQKDIVVCSSFAGRNHSKIKDLIGYFNNIVFIRTSLSGDPSLEKLLDKVHQFVLEAYQYQDLPLQKLMSFPNLIGAPLFQVMFILQNVPNQVLQLPEISASSLDIYNGTANFDLFLSIEEKSEKLIVFLEYKTDLFKTNTITQMLKCFQSLLKNIVANPDQCLSSLLSSTKIEYCHCFDQKSEVIYSNLEKAYTPPYTSPLPEQFEQKSKEILAASKEVLELQLIKIWEKVFKVQPINRHDNFFDLGGHSLLAISLLDQIEKHFGKNLPVTKIFQAPTIAQIIEHWDEEDDAIPWNTLEVYQSKGFLSPFFWVGSTRFIYNLFPLLEKNQPVYGLNILNILSSNSTISIKEIAKQCIQEMQIIQPTGPYYLGGYCGDGESVAWEIGQQLYFKGQKATLFLVDSFYYMAMHGPYWLTYHWSNLLARGPKYLFQKIRKRGKLFFNFLINIFLQKHLLNQLSQHSQSPSQYIQITDAYKNAMVNYTPKFPYPGKIIFFFASELNIKDSPAFAHLTTGGLEIYEILGGTHGNLFVSPQVEILGKQLKQCLEKAQAFHD